MLFRSWKTAAVQVSSAMSIAIEVVEVGLGLEVLDPYGDWAKLAQVAESGCVLVRPDLHVGWRSANLPGDAAAELAKVMRRICHIV